jgi:hypothetical protein
MSRIQSMLWRLLCCGAPLLVSGCLIGFNADRLTGGGGGQPAAAGGGSAADMAVGDMIAPRPGCRDFSGFTAGSAVPNWIDGHGTWRVVTTAQGSMLGQTAASGYQGERFVGWDGNTRGPDLTVETVARLSDHTNENCVLLRGQDTMNYYALCLKDGGQRRNQQQQPPTWALNRVVSGEATQLSYGALDETLPTHVLTLGARGSSLFVTVDGVAMPVVNDTTYVDGSVGLSTDDSGTFATFCAVKP